VARDAQCCIHMRDSSCRGQTHRWTDGWIDRHCAAIRASLACALRANRQRDKAGERDTCTVAEWRANLLNIVKTDDRWSVSTSTWTQHVCMLTCGTTTHTTLHASYHCTQTHTQTDTQSVCQQILCPAGYIRFVSYLFSVFFFSHWTN